MKLSLPNLAKEILANPAWIIRYASPHDPNNESAAIKHLHWSLPHLMTTDNDIFHYNPQHQFYGENISPHILCDIPWNHRDPQLLSYFIKIANDWQCVQRFLQALQLYLLTTPPHPRNWTIYIQFPMIEQLMHIDPLYPNDYTIPPTTNNHSPHFQLYYANDEIIPAPLPNRVPQHIVHAIQRLSARRALPQENISQHDQYPNSNIATLFTAPLSSTTPFSQHTTIERIRRWQEYYPDIPVPIPPN